MIAIVYSRVSTEDQAKHGYSPEIQREQGEARAIALGYPSEQIIHLADDGVSGGLLERPGLNKVRDLIRTGGVGHLICKDLDRLSRSLAHQLLLADEIERAKCRIEYLTFDWQDTPDGVMFRNMRAVFAQFERDKFKKISMESRLKKAEKGGIPQFARCFGYSYSKDTDLLSIVPEQGAAYHLMRDWLLSGKSYDWIAAELNRLGFRTARGNEFMQAGIRRILENPIYKGEYTVHQYDAAGIKFNKYLPKEERSKVKPRPRSEHIIIPVPAIITADEWNDMQEEIARRRYARPGHAVEWYMLSGLCRCGYCSRHMVGLRAAWDNKHPVGSRVRYYVCGTKSKRYKGKPTCISPYHRADKIEAIAWAQIVDWISDPDAFIESLRDKSNNDEDPNEFSIVERQVRALEEERGRLVDLYVRDLIPKTEADRRLQEMKAREEFLRHRLRELKPAKLKPAIDAEAIAGEFEEYQQDLSMATNDEKRRLAQRLIGAVVVTKDEIRISARQPAGTKSIAVN